MPKENFQQGFEFDILDGMKLKKLITLIFLGLVVILPIFVYWRWWQFRRNYNIWRPLANIAEGVAVYESEYGGMPPFETEELVNALSVMGLRGRMPDMRMGEKWTGLDYFGRPIKVFLDGNEIVARSVGANGIAGDSDDAELRKVYKFD